MLAGLASHGVCNEPLGHTLHPNYETFLRTKLNCLVTRRHIGNLQDDIMRKHGPTSTGGMNDVIAMHLRPNIGC
jgi:hypothetical protein